MFGVCKRDVAQKKILLCFRANTNSKARRANVQECASKRSAVLLGSTQDLRVPVKWRMGKIHTHTHTTLNQVTYWHMHREPTS